jgi:hypothetical protein
MKKYPKFDEKLNSHISNNQLQQSKTRPGTIMSYNKMNNTVVIILDDRMTNQVGNIIRNVPCPATQGIQTVAPTAGTRCIIGFTDVNERYPYIVSYIDDANSIGKYMPNYHVNTGVPKFLV